MSEFKSRVERAFDAWRESPDGVKVIAEVIRRARNLSARGFRFYGMKALFESIRYDFSVGLLGDGDFRLNNNHTSLLARHVMQTVPDLDGFFEIRELRGRQ